MRVLSLVFLSLCFFNFGAYAQRPANVSSQVNPTPAPTPTHPYDPLPPKYTCCIRTHTDNSNDDDGDHKNGHACKMMFVEDKCPEHFLTITNHKLCLARVPGYNPRLPIYNQVMLGLPGYKIKPCSL